MKYRCERCGAYLDPGERCDCTEHEQVEQQEAQPPRPHLHRRREDPAAMKAYINRCWQRWFER